MLEHMFIALNSQIICWW